VRLRNDYNRRATGLESVSNEPTKPLEKDLFIRIEPRGDVGLDRLWSLQTPNLQGPY
jgi:hypothetical protein